MCRRQRQSGGCLHLRRPSRHMPLLWRCVQAQQEALVADQAEREAELLARQVQAQERKNREAGADGGSNSSSDTAAEQTKRRKDRRSSDGASDRASDASQGCTEPDYSGMSRKERRKAKKAYEKCCRDAERGQSDGASYDDGSQDETAASGRVKAKTSKRSTGGKGVRATYHYCERDLCLALAAAADGPLSLLRQWLVFLHGRRARASRPPTPAAHPLPPLPPPSRHPADSPAYETSSLYCADAFRGREASLLGRPWTAYCAESILGPMSGEPSHPAACTSCITGRTGAAWGCAGRDGGGREADAMPRLCPADRRPAAAAAAPAADKCGRCIRVTNLATGDSVEATVVDMCGTGGMDLDPEVRLAGLELGFWACAATGQAWVAHPGECMPSRRRRTPAGSPHLPTCPTLPCPPLQAFNPIDSDGAGVRDGHMNVHVEVGWPGVGRRVERLGRMQGLALRCAGPTFGGSDASAGRPCLTLPPAPPVPPCSGAKHDNAISWPGLALEHAPLAARPEPRSCAPRNFGRLCSIAAPACV